MIHISEFICIYIQVTTGALKKLCLLYLLLNILKYREIQRISK